MASSADLGGKSAVAQLNLRKVVSVKDRLLGTLRDILIYHEGTTGVCEWLVRLHWITFAKMAKLWSRFQKFLPPHRRKQENEAGSCQQDWQPPDIVNQLQRLNSLSSQRALAPGSLIAGSSESLILAQKRQWGPLPKAHGYKTTTNVSVPSPEHQLIRARRKEQDDAIPRELQHSKISCDLHDLTASDEAGRRPYCEDAAQRNMYYSPAFHTTAQRHVVGLQRQAHVTRRSPRKASKPPCSYTLKDKSLEVKYLTHNNDESIRTRSSLWSDLHPRSTTGGTSEKRSRSVHVQPTSHNWQPLHKEDRRHSLTHKPNIFDLRNASDIGYSSKHPVSRRDPSGSEASRRSSIKRSRLNAPLPSLPASFSNQRFRNAMDIRKQDSESDNRVERKASPTHMERTADTTIYERWAPAVTRETVIRNIHEIREEHIHKEIHKYHFRHMIQPVVDYQILPPRHFIHENGNLREIDAKDIPVDTPPPDWYAEEVASRLESLPVEEVLWDRDLYQNFAYEPANHPSDAGDFRVHG